MITVRYFFIFCSNSFMLISSKIMASPRKIAALVLDKRCRFYYDFLQHSHDKPSSAPDGSGCRAPVPS
jgi:hypothetical protein